MGFEALLAAQTQTQDEPEADPAAPESADAVSGAAAPAEALLAAMMPLVAGAPAQAQAAAGDPASDEDVAFAPGAMANRPAPLPEQAQGLALGRPDAPGAQGQARAAQAGQGAQGGHAHQASSTGAARGRQAAASLPATPPAATPEPLDSVDAAAFDGGDAPMFLAQPPQVPSPAVARPQPNSPAHGLETALGQAPTTAQPADGEESPASLPDQASGVAVAARAAAPGNADVADAVKGALDHQAPTAPEAAAPETSPEVAARPTQAEAPSAASAAVPAHAAVQTRGAPETVAQLSAQILKKLDERTTRFDLELAPAGLGRVDVRLEIGAHGRLTASLAFDNPQAAAEVRGRAHELTRALEQAGFDLSGGLSFDVAGDRGRQGQGEQSAQSNTAWRGQAFAAALEAAGEADLAATPLSLQRRSHAGFDIRI